MKEVTLEELLEAGCHFGHQVNRANPRAASFIFEERDNIHIINLEKTLEGLQEAGKHLSNIASEGGSIVVVGTKRQAQNVVKDAVAKAWGKGVKNIYYVNARWIGGTLTNYQEVSKNFKKLKDLTEFINVPEKQKGYTKREVLLFGREREKLLNFYEGIADLPGLPSALVIIGTHHERTAVDEAHKMGLDTVGIVDTNSDPRDVDWAIPSNDDAVGAIELITTYLVEAFEEGQIQGEKNKQKAQEDSVKAEKAAVDAENQRVEKEAEKVLRQAQDKTAREGIKAAKTAKAKEPKKIAAKKVAKPTKSS